MTLVSLEQISGATCKFFVNVPSKFFLALQSYSLVYQVFCSRTIADQLLYDRIAEKNGRGVRSYAYIHIF